MANYSTILALHNLGATVEMAYEAVDPINHAMPTGHATKRAVLTALWQFGTTVNAIGWVVGSAIITKVIAEIEKNANDAAELAYDVYKVYAATIFPHFALDADQQDEYGAPVELDHSLPDGDDESDDDSEPGSDFEESGGDSVFR